MGRILISVSTDCCGARVLSDVACTVEHMFESESFGGGTDLVVGCADDEDLSYVVGEPTAEDMLDLLTCVPLTAISLRHLAAIDLDALSPAYRVAALRVWEDFRSWFDAQLNRALVAVGGPAPAPGRERDDWAPEEIAIALRLSTAAAGSRLDDARALHGRLSRTGEALEAGGLTSPHARALVDAVAGFDDAVALAVEAVMLDDGPAFETVTAFRRRLRRAVIAADSRTADRQHLDAVASRKVVMWPEPHGMATVQATLTADEAIIAMRALTGLASMAKAAGDDRPVDVRRADAFTALLHAALTDPKFPAQQRGRAAVGVTMDIATVLGLADNPGHLDGYGPIPPVMARRIAAGGDWHRLVTDPVTGALLDYGRKTYRPPAELVEFIVARDRTCRHPACSQPARLCDIDHAEPFDRTGQGEGGSTSAAGCGALSRRHHRQKTQGNTRLVSHPDGSTTWTTSMGQVVHQPAVDHCPEHTAHMRKLREHREREADPPDRWDSTRSGPTGPPPEETPPASAGPPGAGAAPKDPTTANSQEPDTSSGNDPPPF